ncbi:hypothetical protein FNAPI_4344 [Fusarium napiforme]|uniref:F-box domain-containing protein n=1 Tax=Fusarium napiforme TaxID=42672 RepID=A0A8H5JVN3_9HYPO|nr:hypothetical protein FNAPI_4344 [Fusarium napiforme]
MKQTSSLESLPTEVLQSICAQFCRHCRGDTLIAHPKRPWTYETASDSNITSVPAKPSQDLCALSRVSRRLRDVAQSVLYHEFPKFEHRERRLEPFLQTVTSRPDLARVVKVMAWNADFADDLDLAWARKGYEQGLEVLGVDLNHVWRGRSDDPLELKHYKALHTFLFGDKTNDPRSYNWHLSGVACAEILIMLLALLPNLTTLIADGENINVFLPPSGLRVFGIDRIKLRLLTATHLPHVIMDVAPDLEDMMVGPWGRRSIDCLSRTPILPSIGYLMSPEDFKLEEAPPYRLDTRGLEKILTSYSQPLRFIHFQAFNVRSKVDIPRPSFRYLDNFCTTLQHLILDYGVEARLTGSTIRSLKKFINLKRLFITANLIYPTPHGDSTRDRDSLVNLLPDQIASFTVIDWTLPHFQETPLKYGFNGLLEAMVRGSFPQLKHVRSESSRWRKVRKIYREVGHVVEIADPM